METPQNAARFQPTPSRPGLGEGLDRELIAAIGEGDRDAFRLLYQRWSPRLSSALLRLSLDREIADDLLQDVMLVVWRRAGSFDARRGDVGAWLYTICRHRAIDRHRRRQARAPIEAGDTRRASLTDLGDALGSLVGQATAGWAGNALCRDTGLGAGASGRSTHRDAAIDLDRGLEQLEARERQAIQLAFFAGLTHSEIASRLQIPLGTLKSRIRLGLRKLAVFFESQGLS